MVLLSGEFYRIHDIPGWTNKKVSNEDWESETDPDSRIGKLKDGRFHLKYKAENAVDLETEMIVAAEIYHGNVGETNTIEGAVNTAKTNLREAKTGCEVKEVVADKGYHAEQTLDVLQNESDVRTSVPEPDRKSDRTWADKSERHEVSYRRNRRNTRGVRGRRLQRLRSERVGRTFAHLCDTGGPGRSRIRGLEKVHKRYMLAAMAFNRGRIMRSLIDAGKPRYASVLAQRVLLVYFSIVKRLEGLQAFVTVCQNHSNGVSKIAVVTAA